MKKLLSKLPSLNWVLGAFAICCFFVVSMVLFSAMPAPATPSWRSLFSEVFVSFSIILIFGAVVIFLFYPLLIGYRRGMQPLHIKNQVNELIALSKNTEWDANDMATRLSKLLTQNRANGEQLVRGVVWAGFQTTVLEETAVKENDKAFREYVLTCRRKDNADFLILLIFAPWLAMVLFSQAPLITKAFLSWTLERQALLAGVLLMLYGKVTIKTIFDHLKGK